MSTAEIDMRQLRFRVFMAWILDVDKRSWITQQLSTVVDVLLWH